MDGTLFLILVGIGIALYLSYKIGYTNGEIKACDDLLKMVELELKPFGITPKKYTRK